MIPSNRQYLFARLLICKAAGAVINREMDSFDCKYTDPLSEHLYAERQKLIRMLGQNMQPDMEVVRPYLPELLDEYTELLWANGFPQYYGWSKPCILIAIADASELPELKEFVRNRLGSEWEEPEMGM